MLTYFLGANTRNGFYSLYDGFPPDNSFLHVIKGGPGTGKSSLMRRVALAGEAKGLSVHRVLCSGDPDSLDAVWIPALGQAWVDGTAPHILEPKLFGVNGDYLELGAFLFCPISAREKAELLATQAAYRDKYRQAYELLAKCEAPGEAWKISEYGEASSEPAVHLLPKEKAGQCARLFRGAVSCKGLVRSEALPADWKCVRCSPGALQKTKERALSLGYRVIDCPHPLDPAISEAVLLPEEKLCLEQPVDLRAGTRDLLAQAVTLLREAKAIHDRMELCYREHMDFDGISEMAEKLIAKLFE